jgi:uncharacterized protein YegL
VVRSRRLVIAGGVFMSQLETAVEFAQNPEPRCACVLLLDTSSSMAGPSISALNAGLQTFKDDISSDVLARQRAEIAVVTFGGIVTTVQDFISAGSFEPPSLSADGGTPMGAGILQAIDLVDQRKSEYKQYGVEYYRPWVFMITDGEPTDTWQLAADRVRAAEAANALAFFAVGVAGANMGTLSQISVRTPIKLQGLKFVELFLWLSRSQQRVSAGKPDEMAPLPPVDGWASV